jgi:hypothetical protein
MKLILCPHCGDIVKLFREARSCRCGRSSGWYDDDEVTAIIDGEAIPMGIGNWSLERAVRLRPAGGLGERVDMWVVPINSGRVKQHQEE